MWVEQWLPQLFFKKLGFDLEKIDCCVHGASRWAVKERRLGGVGALEEPRIDCAIFAFSHSQCGPRASSLMMGFAWKRSLGKELFEEVVPTLT